MTLYNSWMNDPAFLAQSAHIFSAISVVMIASYFWDKKGCIYATSIFACIAALKEFGYDLVYELPKQTIGDSLLDYSFYIVGLMLAFGLVMLFTPKTKE
jgi:hypothetical protein